MADVVKMQPQSLDAEKAVLGAILLDKDSIIKIADFLAPEYFYDDKNRYVYESMMDL